MPRALGRRAGTGGEWASPGKEGNHGTQREEPETIRRGQRSWYTGYIEKRVTKADERREVAGAEGLLGVGLAEAEPGHIHPGSGACRAADSYRGENPPENISIPFALLNSGATT